MKKTTCLLLISLLLVSCESKRVRISTTSMEGTLKLGEIVLVNPTKEIVRNQIVAFKHYDINFGEDIWAFRVVGIPGDTLEIKNGEVYINSLKMTEPQQIKYEYNVKTNAKLNPKFIESYEYRFINSSEYIFYLTTEQKNKLSVNPAIIEINRNNFEPETLNKRLFKPDTLLNWSRDNYGPIYVPKKVEGEEASKLYFLLGDNRHNANDSRFIGFVPLSNIIGTIKEKDNRR